ncbi:hypothetical protein GQ53DRAFT_855508 [Thozetella sp. PMI_491]|nr:hypothetical protein GQ53DRAFT_855508 [Thozetella sp. PMI_491]
MPQTKPTRSRNGCTDCRARRIKCDEQQPRCGRCSRLNLECCKPEPPVPLKLRRRGYGSLKSRPAWNAPHILPSHPLPRNSNATLEGPAPSTAENSASCLNVLTPQGNQTGLPSHVSLLPNDDWDATLCNPNLDMGPILDAPNGWLDSLLTPLEPAQPSNIADSSEPVIEDFLAGTFNTSSTILPIEQRFRGYFRTELSTFPLIYDLPEALGLGGNEKRALAYYQSHFSDRKSVKGFSWSQYSLYLSAATSHRMILDLILAISFLGVSRHTHDQDIWRFGKGRLQKDPNHVAVIISFWILLNLIMDNDALTTGIDRRDLSTKIFKYVSTHQLDRLVSGTTVSRSLLIKVLSMIVYADTQLNFNTRGSPLSRYFFDRPQTRNVLHLSQNYLQLNHGQKYPLSELLYDVEISPCFEAFYEQHRMYHLLNQLFWVGIGDYNDLAQMIQSLESSSYSRLHFHIDAAVCEFYAIRLYHFRCDSGREPNDSIRDLLASYLQIAHRMQRIKVQYYWFDRSLFLIGAETRDAIHREWIQSRMVRTDLKKSLQRIWESERASGHRIRQQEMRNILRDEGEAYDAIMPTF